MQHRRGEGDGGELLARVWDLLLEANERTGDELIGVLRLAHQQRRLRRLHRQPEGERGRKRRHVRHHVRHEGKQLVRAHLHLFLALHPRVDAADEREAREDQRDEGEGRAAEGAGGGVAVRGVEDAAVHVGLIRVEAVDEARDRRELERSVRIDGLRARVVCVFGRVLDEEGRDEREELARVGREGDDAFLLDDKRDEARGDLLAPLVREV
mmetsp:Transcript_29775/g.74438  ORF Transcript_29775/g.74438 Transcript_29775/m.74438 type:complete len:211 (-) Transcript_29775:1320-1952(-)